MFMNEKGKVVAKLTDEKWLYDLGLLCDIGHHFLKHQTSRPKETLFWYV
jgi:hypothetical protein